MTHQGCSFLKKRTKRLLILRKRTDPGLGRMGESGGEHKSLLVLAGQASASFRNEHTYFFFS
jgi:hypothetical protein